MKKLILLDSVHEYDYTFENKVHSLFYSQGEQWSDSTRGTLAMSITDTGNELKIRGEKTKKLNYMTALHLTILLKIIHSDYKFEIADKKLL